MLFLQKSNSMFKHRSKIINLQRIFLSSDKLNRIHDKTIKENNHSWINSKQTQLETSNMSQLKTVHLMDVSKETFDIYKQYVQTEEIQFLNSIFKNHGFEMRMAGGGVRDLLCHIAPHDIDFATPATPTQMTDMMKDFENIRLITTLSGINHGTITARINNSVQYEITTLRIDKATDGRHAQVEFVNDWKIDASRRDLTINSMFIDLNGFLYDYFGGKEDLYNKRIRFVGDAERRVREDYLRIFRYFRFHTRFGIPGVHDRDTIQKMKDNLHGLEMISGERIWAELKRILSSTNCASSVEVLFQEMDTAQWLGFKRSKLNLERFYKTLQNIVKISDYPLKHPWCPHILFSSLIENIEELVTISTRLRLSNIEQNSIAYIITNRDYSSEISEKRLRTTLALTPKPDQAHLRQHIIQYLYSLGQEIDLINSIQEWKIPDFPFKGNMIANKVKRKQQISQLKSELMKEWAKSDFVMSESEMQSKVDEILEKILSSKT